MDLAISLSELALHLYEAGNRERVIELSERSVALRRTAWQQDPANVRFAGRLVYSLTALSQYQAGLKNWNLAVAAARQAVEVVDRSAGRLDSPSEALRAYLQLAYCEKRSGKDSCPHLLAARKLYGGSASPADRTRLESMLKACR